MANLKLSKANTDRIEALKKKFEAKGLRKKDWSDILNHAFEAISDSSIEKMVDQHVPDDVVIRQAMMNPDMKKRFAEMLRKESKKSVKTDSVKADAPKVPKTEVKKPAVAPTTEAQVKKPAAPIEAPKATATKAS